MPLRAPALFRRHPFSTSTRTRIALPPHYHSYHPPATGMPLNPVAVPKLGRIGRWYLPTMALIAVGMTLSSYLQSSPSWNRRRTVTLHSANRQIGFAINNALEEHNNKQNRPMTQEEKNLMLMEAYGDRNSLEDMERALNATTKMGKMERNKMLDEAYGERKSLRDVERALEVYEVQ